MWHVRNTFHQMYLEGNGNSWAPNFFLVVLHGKGRLLNSWCPLYWSGFTPAWTSFWFTYKGWNVPVRVCRWLPQDGETSPYVDWLWLGNTVTLNKDWTVRGTVIPIEVFKMCLCSLLPFSALDILILLISELGFWSTRIFLIISGEIKVPWLRIKSKSPCVLVALQGCWAGLGGAPHDFRETARCPWEQKAEQVSFAGGPGEQLSRWWRSRSCSYTFRATAEWPMFFL